MIIRGQDLSAPDRAVRSVAGTVEGNSDDRLCPIVFRHAGKDVGVMMLDAEDRDLPAFCDLFCNCCGIVFGMEITDNCLRCHFEQGLHTSDRLLQGAHSAEVLQVSDIGRQIKEIARGDAEGVFQLTADRQDTAIHIPREQHRERRISAGTADHIGLAAVKIHDGIVGADPDQPVVAENTVTECRELRKGVLIVTADGGAGDVSACHDQTIRHLKSVIIGKKKMLERCIGKHDTHLGIPGRNRLSQKGVLSLSCYIRRICKRLFPAGSCLIVCQYRSGLSFVQKKDGLLVACQDLMLFLIEKTFAADRFLVFHHDRKRLGRTPFSVAQLLHCLLAGRVTAKVKTADSLDCHNAAFENGPAGGRDGIPSYDLRPDPSPGSLYRLVRFFKVFPVPCPVLTLFYGEQVDLRAAVVAADGLSIIPA